MIDTMLKIDVPNVNKTFPKYPMTMEDKGWIYGVWYCGASFTKANFYGKYPGNFLARALALFPGAGDILHCPSGTVKGPGVTVDIIKDELRQPQYQASADDLPFSNDSFDLILSDPPYSAEDSKKYGCKPWPQRGSMEEFRRILRPGGVLGVLHVRYPAYKSTEWKLVGLIAVITGFQRLTRIFALYRVLK